MPFGASAIFCFTSSTLATHLRTFFIWGNRKITQGEIGWIGRVGHRVMSFFGQKLLYTHCGVGRCSCKSPIMKWANALKESSSKFTEAEPASHNNASWYSDTDVFLGYLPSRRSLYSRVPALQKVIPSLFVCFSVGCLPALYYSELCPFDSVNSSDIFRQGLG